MWEWKDLGDGVPWFKSSDPWILIFRIDWLISCSQSLTQIANVSLSSPVFSILDISSRVVNVSLASTFLNKDKNVLKGNAGKISNDRSWKNDNARFTRVPFIPLSDQSCGIFCRFSRFKHFISDNSFVSLQ